jgi:hypothetical protein
LAAFLRKVYKCAKAVMEMWWGSFKNVYTGTQVKFKNVWRFKLKIYEPSLTIKKTTFVKRKLLQKITNIDIQNRLFFKKKSSAIIKCLKIFYNPFVISLKIYYLNASLLEKSPLLCPHVRIQD